MGNISGVLNSVLINSGITKEPIPCSKLLQKMVDDLGLKKNSNINYSSPLQSLPPITLSSQFSLSVTPVIEHMSVIEHIPVIEHMPVIERMPVLKQKTSITGWKIKSTGGKTDVLKFVGGAGTRIYAVTQILLQDKDLTTSAVLVV